MAVIVIAAIVLSVVLIKSKDPEVDTREELELADILQAKLRPHSFNGTWIDDNSFHFFDSKVSFLFKLYRRRRFS